MNLLEQPWYIGLAPLLGWLLDAVVRTGPLDGSIDRTLGRLVGRLEFAMRTGMGEQLKHAGAILSAWVGGSAAVGAWALVAVGIVLGGPVGRFVATAALFFAILDTRSRASDALGVERMLLAGRDVEAEAELRRMGNAPSDPSPGALAGAGVLAVSDGLLLRVFVPLVWGLVFGPIGGAAAFGLVAVILRRRVSSEEDQSIWHWPDRLENWLSWPAAWVANICLQVVAPVAGVRRGDVFSAFIHRPALRPGDRLRAAFVGGFHLGEEVGGPRDGVAAVPSDIQRAVVLMWTSSFLLLALGTALRCLVLGLL